MLEGGEPEPLRPVMPGLAIRADSVTAGRAEGRLAADPALIGHGVPIALEARRLVGAGLPEKWLLEELEEAARRCPALGRVRNLVPLELPARHNADLAEGATPRIDRFPPRLPSDRSPSLSWRALRGGGRRLGREAS